MGAKEIYNTLLNALGITPAILEKKAALGYRTVKNAIDRDSSITANTAEKIISAYPEVSFNWLLTGKGEMLRDEPLFNEENEAKYSLAVTNPEVVFIHDKDGNITYAYTAEEYTELMTNMVDEAIRDAQIGKSARIDAAILKHRFSKLLKSRLHGASFDVSQQDLNTLPEVLQQAISGAIDDVQHSEQTTLSEISKQRGVSVGDLKRHIEENEITPARELENGPMVVKLYYLSDFEDLEYYS